MKYSILICIFILFLQCSFRPKKPVFESEKNLFDYYQTIQKDSIITENLATYSDPSRFIKGVFQSVITPDSVFIQVQGPLNLKMADLSCFDDIVHLESYFPEKNSLDYSYETLPYIFPILSMPLNRKIAEKLTLLIPLFYEEHEIKKKSSLVFSQNINNHTELNFFFHQKKNKIDSIKISRDGKEFLSIEYTDYLMDKFYYLPQRMIIKTINSYPKRQLIINNRKRIYHNKKQ